MSYILKAEPLETQANKVQIINESSTDEQYPSAKAVKDAIADIKMAAADSRIYIGSGDMPEGYVLQIDPEGEALTVDQIYNAESENPQSGKAVAEAIKTAGITDEKPGVKTPNGEIFNDYENNQAGLKAFNITNVVQNGQTATLTLDSVEGLATGDLVSALISPNTFDHFGKITAISENVITVSITDTGLSLGTKTTGDLWIPAKPYIGTKVYGQYGFAANTGTKASAKAAAAFGEANIAGSKRAFVAGGEDNFAGYCCTVGGQVNTVRGVRSAGFGYKNDIATTAQYGFVVGQNNKVRSNGTFVEGSNNTDGYNSKIGANHIEGAGNVIGDGTYGRIHIEGEGNKVESGGQASHIEGKGNIMHSGAVNHMDGINNEITGGYNTISGQYNIIEGNYNDIGGSYNTVKENGSNNFVRGGHHNITGDYKAYFGKNSVDNPDAILVVGNGKTVNDRNNAFQVLADGSATIAKAGRSPDGVVRYDQFVQKLYKELDDLIGVGTDISQASAYNKFFIVID